MNDWHAPARASRRRRARLRKIFILLSAGAIVVAVMMFLGMDVTSAPGRETIGGHGNTQPLLLPMAIFIAGMIGLAVCLP